MPAKGPLQSVQVFGRKVRPERGARFIVSSFSGWAALCGLARALSFGPSRGAAAAAAGQGRVAGMERGRARDGESCSQPTCPVQ